MSFKKNLTFKIIILLITTVLVFFVSLKLYFYLKFDYSFVKNQISEFCKNKLNKAVKFEDISLNYKGNIVITKFDLSNSDDFNDNINIIIAEKLIVKLDTFKLFDKKILIHELDFINSKFSFYKKNDYGYGETIDNLLSYSRKNGKELFSENLVIKTVDSIIKFKEDHLDKNLIFGLSNIQTEMKFSSKKVDYEIKGDFISHNNIEDIGEFEINGSLFLNDTNKINADIEINSFPIKNFALLFDKLDLSNLSASGLLNVKISLTADKNILQLNGDASTVNFTLKNLFERYNIVSNKNLNFKIDYKSDENQFIVKRLKIFDDKFKLDMSGKYIDSKTENRIIFNIKPVKINLTHISDFFTPFKNIFYNGIIEIDSNVNYDFNLKDNPIINTHLKVKRFNAISKPGFNVLKHTHIDFNFNNDVLNFRYKGKVFKSDIDLNLVSKIKKWLPFESKSSLNVNSDKMEFNLIFKGISRLINKIYLTAYKDKKKGYEHILFKSTDLGKSIMRNDLNIDCSIKNILLGGKAKLENFIYKAEFKKGVFKVSDFFLSGYNAVYKLDYIQGFFNNDYPIIEWKGIISKFDLEEFSKDYGKSLDLTGIATLEFEYRLNAFRIGHLIKNLKGFTSLIIEKGSMKNISFQKNFPDYLSSNGIKMNSFDNFEFKRFSILLSQFSGKFLINNFKLMSDKINFATRGVYKFFKGLRVTVYPVIITSENKIKRIPLIIEGPFLKPLISLRYKKNVEKLLLFNIQ